MEPYFNSLIETLKKLKSFSLISFGEDYKWIHFYLPEEESLDILASQLDDIKDHYACTLLSLINQNNKEDKSYQLLLNDDKLEDLIQVLDKKINSLIEFQGDKNKAENKEKGLPDLSLVTIHQMTKELKNRHNLTFALVWMENNEKDNIAIEGSGNPTQLIGLLTRGTHIAIEWADKGIKFRKTKDE